MATLEVPPQAVVAETVGPYLTGIMLQQLLMGVVVVQVYDYFRLFPRDSRFNKWLVSLLFIISTTQTIFDYLSLYRSSVHFYGQYDRFNEADWKLWSEVGITAVIGAISQAFFLERCFAAKKSWFVLVGGGVAVMASLGAGIAASVSAAQKGTVTDMSHSRVVMALWLGSSALIGIVTSVILILGLTRVRSEFSKTEAIVTRIVRLSFTTSALTAAVTLVDIALTLSLPNTSWHLLAFFPLGKIYAISVLVTLSSRRELRAMMESDPQTVMTTATRAIPSIGRADFLTTPRPAVTGIKVSTTHTYHVDRNSTSGREDSLSDVKLPLEGSTGGTFVVHRPQGVRSSLASKRSFSSSTYGKDLDYFVSTDTDQLESHLDLDLEMDVMSVGHAEDQRPFAPHSTVNVDRTGVQNSSTPHSGRIPVVVVEER